jgi:hypothetical protein
MVITVQFKDRNKNFRGKTYDYLLHKEEDIPKNGDIIRMMDENYNYLCYGTRVKVTNLRHSVSSDKEKLSVIRYVAATLD